MPAKLVYYYQSSVNQYGVVTYIAEMDYRIDNLFTDEIYLKNVNDNINEC